LPDHEHGSIIKFTNVKESRQKILLFSLPQSFLKGKNADKTSWVLWKEKDGKYHTAWKTHNTGV